MDQQSKIPSGCRWHRLIGLSALLLAFCWPRPADGWIAPEHAEMTRLALTRYLPDPAVDVLREAVRQARRPAPAGGNQVFAGLPLCEEVGTPFHQLKLMSSHRSGEGNSATANPLTTPYVRCVSYSSLPALAGDHALTIEELEELLSKDVDRVLFPDLKVAQMIIGTAVKAWKEFREDVPPEFVSAWEIDPEQPFHPHEPEPVRNRRHLLRDIDVRLQLVDHGYASRAGETRAHYQDTATSLGKLIHQLKAVGNVDNAFNQMTARHLRSLVLAVAANEARKGGDDAGYQLLVTQALLEHAFAMHFLQDAFSAGHMATSHAVIASYDRLRRHDHFSRHGLAARRALAARPCDPVAGWPAPHREGQPPPCWVAYGDGFMEQLNLHYAAHAGASMQLLFALALDPGLAERLANGSQIDRAEDLLDRFPNWVPQPSQAPRDSALEAVTFALKRLRAHTGSHLHATISCGEDAAHQDGARKLAQAFLNEECLLDPDADCELSVLIRPIMVLWPTIRGDVRLMDGADSFGVGPAYQLGYVLQGGYVLGAGDGENMHDHFAAAAGLSAGISYRWDSLMPGQDNRAFIEGNVGIAPLLVSGLQLQNDQGGADRTLFGVGFFAEARAPVLPMLLLGFGYLTRSSDVVSSVRLPFGVGPYGVRVYGLFPGFVTEQEQSFDIVGWDVEVAYLSLVGERPAHEASRSIPIDSELRLRIGKSLLQNELARRRGLPTGGGQLWISLELAGGYSWFF